MTTEHMAIMQTKIAELENERGKLRAFLDAFCGCQGHKGYLELCGQAFELRQELDAKETPRRRPVPRTRSIHTDI